MKRHNDTNHRKAAALAGILTITVAATILAGPVSLDADAAGYQVNPARTLTTQAATAGEKAAQSAAEMAITASVTAASDDTSRTLEATLEALIQAGDWTMISNYTDETLNINSMAGGLEPLTSYRVTFAATDETAMQETGQAMVVVPLREVMNGRTLAAGESVQGFLYNDADGVFYATTTTIVGDQIVYNVPFFPANTNDHILFYVSRGEWTATATSYDYLAIGNSITMHPRRDFWPDAMGMGASSVAKDYFHIVKRGLTRFQSNVNAAALNYSIWEIMPENRQSALGLLDKYLSPDLELVSIMLGENVITYRGDFAADYPALIQYVKTKAPNALIVLIGTFWQDDEIETIKMQTAAQYGCLYVSLADIQNNTRYQFGSGSAADANGVRHNSDNPGTSIHPNDAAMSYIGNGVLAAVSAAYTSAAEAVADKADAEIDAAYTVDAAEIVVDAESR